MWLQANKMSFKGATENKYQYLIDTHIIPDLGEIKISRITAKTINSFLENKLQNGDVKNREYVEGETLESIVGNHEPQTACLVVEWAKVLCDMLRYLHSQKPPLIYRDMKPANVILTSD